MNDNTKRLLDSPTPDREMLHAQMDRIVSGTYDAGHKAGMRLGYDNGFVAGEAVALQEHENAACLRADKALGIGLLVGTGFGVILAVLVGSFL